MTDRIPVHALNATGTLDGSTALHGDGTWKVPTGGGSGAGSYVGESPLVRYEKSATVVTVDSTSATHVAFPFTCTLRSGKHLVQYRAASIHGWTSDGVVKLKSSTNDGATWSAATTMADAAGGDDNGGGLAQFRDGTVIGLVVRRPTSTETGWYSESMRSTDEGATWDTPVTLNAGASGFEYATNIKVLPNGDALAFLYCNSGGDDFITVMVSTDDGATWSIRSTLTGAAGDNYQEPQAVVMPDGELLMFFRYEDTPYVAASSEIRMTRSTDSGATWSTPVSLGTGISGQPAPHLTRNGLLVLAFREETSGTYYLRWQTSKDRGNTWAVEETWTDTAPNGYAYAGWFDLADGDIGLAYGLEPTPSTGADLFFRRFTRSLAETLPLGQLDATGGAEGDVLTKVSGVWTAAAPTGGSSTSSGELLMQDGVTAPPVPLETEARDDWLYQG